MNKAELIKQLRKAHEKQLFDDEAVERVLDEYAQQEKRETAIEFAEHVLNEVMPDAKILNNYVGYGGMYGKWKSNQEGE